MVRKLAASAAVCCAWAMVVLPAGPSAAAAGPLAVTAGPLGVTAQDPEPEPAGGLATVRTLVANTGSARSGAFTLVVTLPQGTTPEEPFFPERCTVSGQTVTCHYPKGLPARNTATALVPARIAADATGVLDDGTVTVSEDAHPEAADTGTFAIAVADAVLTD
ncbi:hypothetical protein ACIRBX_27085 [Kitasatospora sp. NPDC096147]|uniref:hypothetical protein n=1 Tax=Kitasatospora sp. NPDC096147 TaxID=3364093 RepID=UPI003801CCDD